MWEELDKVNEKDNYVRCPNCDNVMVLRDGKNGKFFGCQNYPNCTGTRNYSEGRNKEYYKPEDLFDISRGDKGKCNRCGQYPAYGSLSSLGLCPSCQEKFDEE